jgi:DNA primase
MPDGVLVRPLSDIAKQELVKMTEGYASMVDAVEWYLELRGITRETAVKFMLGYTGEEPFSDHPPDRLSIPSLDAMGQPVFLSFRALDDGKPKYLHQHGPSHLFNPRAILQADDVINITEGQLDAIVLEQCGMHAVGVLGAKAWKKHHPRMFAGFRKVFVWGDGDAPGKDFARAVCDSIPQAVAVTMRPDCKDVNDLFLAYGEDGIHDVIDE